MMHFALQTVDMGKYLILLQVGRAVQPRQLGESQIEAMIKRWFVEDHTSQAHLWEEDRTVAEWLAGQLDPASKSVAQVPNLSACLFAVCAIFLFMIYYSRCF